MSVANALKLDRIIESALYVNDSARSRKFYCEVLGLKPLLETDTLCAFDVGGKNVLLIFQRGGSTQTQVLSGVGGASYGEIPPHDGSGPSHICFAICAEQLRLWEARLTDCKIAIEGRMHWARGGESIYFRDPDNHLLEFMTPGSWLIY